MPRTLYLHIGAHRTATTSTQFYLDRNRDALPARGVLYPMKVRRHLQTFNQLFAEELTVAAVCDRLEADADAAEAETGEPVHTIVLSDEDVAMRPDLSRLQGFTERFDTRAIYSMRRQDIWLESWYFQNIKWQWIDGLSHATFADFMARRADFHWIDYDAVLTRLEALFGRDAVVPLVFETGQMPDGPVAAFCDAIGLTDREGLQDAVHANTSRSPQMAEFMRHLPLDQAPPQVRNALIHACERVDRKVLGNTGKQSERIMPARQRRQVMAGFEPGNQAVAQRYFGRDRLFLDPLPGRLASLARMALPKSTDALMAQYVGPMLAELLAHDMIKPGTGKPQQVDPAPRKPKTEP